MVNQFRSEGSENRWALLLEVPCTIHRDTYRFSKILKNRSFSSLALVQVKLPQVMLVAKTPAVYILQFAFSCLIPFHDVVRPP